MDRQVFVSYRSVDQPFVAAFCEELKSLGYSVWHDRDEIRIGDNWLRAIGEATAQSASVLLFLTVQSHAALHEGRGGLAVEIEKILSLRSQSSTDRQLAIYVVDCCGITDAQMAETALLKQLSNDRRLAAHDAHTSFLSGDRRALRAVVRDFVREALGNRLTIYPRAAKVTGDGAYLLSWATAGPHDTIERRREVSSWEGEPRSAIPLQTRSGQPCLALSISHRLRDPEADSWWCAGIGLAFSPAGRWLAVDLTPHARILFDARMTRTMSWSEEAAPLLMGFADVNLQSTGWNRTPIEVSEAFRLYSLDLDADFGWSRSDWPTNRRDVDRSAILQIMFGQDATVPNCEARFEIRDIRLQPR